MLGYLDAFNFEEDSVGIYFYVGVFLVNGQNKINLSVKQRGMEILIDYNPWKVNDYYRFFCYKNYLFVVNSRIKPPAFINNLFSKSERMGNLIIYTNPYVKKRKDKLLDVGTIYYEEYYYENNSFILKGKTMLE